MVVKVVGTLNGGTWREQSWVIIKEAPVSRLAEGQAWKESPGTDQ